MARTADQSRNPAPHPAFLGFRRPLATLIAVILVGAGCGGGPAATANATTGASPSSPTAQLPDSSASAVTSPAPSPTAGLQSGPSPSGGQPTTGELPSLLADTYGVFLLRSDVDAADQAGAWYLTLSPSLRYEFGHVPHDASPNTGNLATDGSMFTFSRERGPGACVGGPGTYRYILEGDQLVLTLLEDACSVRIRQSTARPYVRCPAGPDTCRIEQR